MQNQPGAQSPPSGQPGTPSPTQPGLQNVQLSHQTFVNLEPLIREKEKLRHQKELEIQVRQLEEDKSKLFGVIASVSTERDQFRNRQKITTRKC